LFHLATARALFHAGQWDDALAEARAGLAISDETETQVWAPWTRALIARIHVHRDELGAAEQELHAARAQEENAGCAQFGEYWINWSEAMLHEARNDPRAAADVLAAEWDRWPADEPVGDHRETALDMMRLASAIDDTERASRVVDVVEKAASRWPSPSSRATAEACRGRLQGDASLLEEAARSLEPSGRSLFAAQSFEEAALLDAKRGIELLREALRIYEVLGATRDVARVEARLRAAGARRGRRGPRTRPTHGWESLTETEVRVATLVAEGLTNRQIAERLFVSHRTVDTHVSHALAKLGISGRAELAVEATRRSL
jgi:DNA-binding CsgD family transcriptional regulator